MHRHIGELRRIAAGARRIAALRERAGRQNGGERRGAREEIAAGEAHGPDFAPPPAGRPTLPGRVNAASAEVENIVEERLAALLLRPVAVAGIRTLILIPPVFIRRLGSALRVVGLLGLALRRSPLENLVELAPVEPHAAALGAIVDLDAVALGHDQFGS